MFDLRTIAENTTLVFLLSILFSLIYPKFSFNLKNAVVPLLILIMILSIKDIKFKLQDIKKYRKNILVSILLNYVFLFLLIVISAYILVDNPEYLKGFVVMAAIPPAVAVVPFTFLLRGDSELSMISEAVMYLLSIILVPAVIYIFFTDTVDILYLIKTTLLLVLFPIIFSRVIHTSKSKIFSYSKSMINLSFFFIVYAIVGINQASIISNPKILLPVFIVILLRTFVSSTFVYLVSKNVVSRKIAVTYTLFASYKNLGMTAAVALNLFGIESSLPAAVGTIFELVLLIYLERLVRY